MSEIIEVYVPVAPTVVEVVAVGPQGPSGGGSYTLPIATASVLGGVKVGDGLAVDGAGVLSVTTAPGGETNLSYSATTTAVTIASDTGTDATILAASGTIAGVMTATQFTKLDGIAVGATVGANWSVNLTNIPSVVSAMTSQAAAAQAIGKEAISAELLSTIAGPAKIGGLALEELPPNGTEFTFAVWDATEQFFTWYGSTAIAPLIGLGSTDSPAFAGLSTTGNVSFYGQTATLTISLGLTSTVLYGSANSGVEITMPATSGTLALAVAAASQAEMEAGTEAAIRSMSPLRVKQAIAALAGSGGALATVSITGTATTAVAANTIYRHSGASAYTSTLTTAGLATGNILYIQIANTATALITISCAAGIRGATTKVMRNGEALHLYWTGTTFDILGEVFIPFKGTIAPNAPATISTGTNTKVGINTVIGDNPGYGMLDTANQRIVFPRAGVYQLIAAVRYDNLSANAVRAIQAYTYDGVTFFNQEEDALLAGGQGFVGTTSNVTVTAAGKILELTAWQNSGANAIIKGNGTEENTRLVVLQLS